MGYCVSCAGFERASSRAQWPCGASVLSRIPLGYACSQTLLDKSMIREVPKVVGLDTSLLTYIFDYSLLHSVLYNYPNVAE